MEKKNPAAAEKQPETLPRQGVKDPGSYHELGPMTPPPSLLARPRGHLFVPVRGGTRTSNGPKPGSRAPNRDQWPG